MNRTIAYSFLSAIGLLLAAITASKPILLSDQNRFLLNLVDKDLLMVLGVILSITLASAGQIHLSLNDIESKVGYTFLTTTRAGVHSSAYWLIAIFMAAIVVVVMKPYFLYSISGQAFFNSCALFILFWMVLIMTSLTRLVFAIRPHFDPHD